MIDLKQWRTAKGITQSAAADKLAMTLRHYQRLEAGHAPVNKRTALLLKAVKH